jgi:hypothetical protein
MAASFSTTQVFTSGQKNVGHTHFNAIVSGLSVTNIGATELSDSGITAVKVNADIQGVGLDKNSSTKALDIVGYGFETNALTNANVGLTRVTNKKIQKFTGTLTGAVVINLSRSSAIAGDEFWIRLGGVVTTAAFTLTLQENASGSLKVFNEARTVTGTIVAAYNGSAWEVVSEHIVQQ